jgi:hypothetical protein
MAAGRAVPEALERGTAPDSGRLSGRAAALIAFYSLPVPLGDPADRFAEPPAGSS